MGTVTLLLTMLLGCGLLDPGPSVLDTPSAVDPTPPEPREITAVALARRPDLLRSVELSDNNRPDGKAAPATFGLAGGFRYEENKRGADVYATPLPIRSNLIPDKLHGTHTFGSSAPPDLVVAGPHGELPFQRWGRGADAWGYDRESLYIGVAEGSDAPDPSAYRIRFPKATEHENALNRGASGLSDQDFVFRSLTIDKTSHTGLYLPAPSTSTWEVTVPADAVLTFRGTVLTPAIADDATSDGADVVVEVVDGGTTVEVGRALLPVGHWSPQRFDLSAFAGRKVELRVRTEARGNPVYDYVFLEGPTLYTPEDDPRRVVIVFIDTLRADHLQTYGYERPTTPKIDRWARHGAVFDAARTVAPWTLPSARSALSGRQPELWFEGENLPERLADAGFHTDAIVANAFLSQPFSMERGWTRFTYEHMLEAPAVARHAREVLAEHPDRDVALLVHFMDAHLPYDEPFTYRHLFAGFRPSALDSLTRRWLFEVDEETEGFAEIVDHVVDRYDQNLRYIDDNLGPLLEDAGLDATVVLFSDHGEEFWDHGSFEHGHTFHDELLRVPFVVRSPHTPPGRHDAPVSLLDLAPTVLELEGLPPLPGDGTSLVGLLHGDEAAAEALAERPQAFGRPLYGDDGWAVLADGHKWIDRGGQQRLYDVDTEPAELTDLAGHTDLSPYPAALGEALDREVHLVWRVEIESGPAVLENQLYVSHPDGIAAAWASYDPRGRYGLSPVDVVDGIARIRQPKDEDMPPTVFVVPNGDARDTAGLEVTVDGYGVRLTRPATRPRFEPAAEAPEILRIEEEGWRVEVDLAWVPMPEGRAISGFASEMEAQLRELGYLE